MLIKWFFEQASDFHLGDGVYGPRWQNVISERAAIAEGDAAVKTLIMALCKKRDGDKVREPKKRGSKSSRRFSPI